MSFKHLSTPLSFSTLLGSAATGSLNADAVWSVSPGSLALPAPITIHPLLEEREALGPPYWMTVGMVDQSSLYHQLKPQ